MKYLLFRKQLKQFTVFSLKDIRVLDQKFYRSRLNDWQKAGYIKKIIRGYYIFSDKNIDDNVLFEIAGKIYNPSYVSFEIALSYYGLIPEIVYSITSATTKKTVTFETEIARFSYHTISLRLFFGYELIPYNNKNFKMASPEKAVLDYLYINTHIKSDADFASLRIDKETFFSKINEKQFFLYLDMFNKKRFCRRVLAFWEFMKNA